MNVSGRCVETTAADRFGEGAGQCFPARDRQLAVSTDAAVGYRLTGDRLAVTERTRQLFFVRWYGQYHAPRGVESRR